MSLLAEQLTGEIPGLLRRGSPVTLANGVAGVVVLVYASGAIAMAISDRQIVTEPPGLYTLDTSDPTGRFHAREWLAEHGHDVGNEDRAEVLAWSVLSVWRGGKPCKGVAGPWLDMDAIYRANGSHNGPKWERCGRARPNGGPETPLLGYVQAAKREWQEDAGWLVQPNGPFQSHKLPRGPECGEAGKTACDAALIVDGWALTNDDGSLTLPPLPEVA